jgi:hypothetical protein
MAAMWFQILSHLESYLQEHVSESDIQQGFSRNERIPKPPAIRIYRVDEPDMDIWLRPKGSLTLTLEIWEGNDKQDPKAANQQLANREEEVQNALKVWVKKIESDLKLKVTKCHLSSLGDGEQYRPQVAVFYRLTFDWAK